MRLPIKDALPRLLANVAAPLLVAYLALLLLTTYFSQQTLQVATSNERRLELEKRATALSYFYSERKADIDRLAGDRAVTTFFSNRALGMSMEYGLRASLIAMQTVANDLLVSKVISGIRLYRRIAILDHDGSPIVDVGPAADTNIPWSESSLRSAADASVLVKDDQAGQHVLLVHEVADRGRLLGFVVAEVAHDEVIEKLIQTPGGRLSPIKIGTVGGSPSLLESDGPSSSVAKDPQYRDSITVRVADTPFVLTTPFNSTGSSDLLGSRLYLGLMAGLAVVVLVVLGIGVHDRSRSLALRARVEEAQRQSVLLNHQNEQLAAEIAKRLTSEAFFRTLVDSVPDLVWLKDPNGTFLFCNPQCGRLYGAKEPDIIGRTDYDFVEKDRADLFRHHDQAAMHAGQPSMNEEVVTFGVDKQQARLETIRSPMYDPDGQLIGVLGIARDITERKRTEEQLRTLSQAVEQSPVSVIIMNPQGDVQYINRAYEQATGYRLEEVAGQRLDFLQAGAAPDIVLDELWKTILAGQTWQGEIESRRKDGSLFWERVRVSPVLDAHGSVSHFLALKEDMTLQKQQEQKILYQAHFDGLTNLPNRFLALDRLSQLLKEASRRSGFVAVLFIDLDDFKKVNDTLGHEVGDKVLIKAAERIRDSVRAEDTVGRLGGDEFIVLLSGLDNVAEADGLAVRILDSLRAAFRIDGRDLILTASIGIAFYPTDGEIPAQLLRNADMAMYKSKELGRNTYYHYAKTLNASAERRLTLEEQLHGALGRGELSVVYQPLMAVRSKQIVGAEALLRWHNPALGEVAPDEFIPIAEKTGLIVPIGKYVLSEALNTLRDWREATGMNLVMSVNISPRQLLDSHLPDDAARMLHEANLSGACLQLEVTEGVLLVGGASVDRALKMLSDNGVLIAMDDFGTGYASLSYLRRHPFDVLKIDRSFMWELERNPTNGELVAAAIVMAHGLGLTVVCEGVESENQLEFLARQNCDIVQGNLIGHPVQAHTLLGNIVPRTIVAVDDDQDQTGSQSVPHDSSGWASSMN